MIKRMNLESRTEYEQHKENQEQFKKLMPILSALDEEEMRIFMHLLESKNQQQNVSKQLTMTLVDEACSNEAKEKLAKLSEEENFALKSTYTHTKRTMQYAKKDKMPVDESKVKDLLRNQHIFRDRFKKDVGTYTGQREINSFENGLLTYVNEAAWGDLRDLLTDIGINK
jgi:hypothetical protein